MAKARKEGKPNKNRTNLHKWEKIMKRNNELIFQYTEKLRLEKNS